MIREEKALEQEPCEDTISRQMVLDYIYNDLGLGDEENGKDVERQIELESFYKYIKSLPPVTPKAEWIPISSKRLPSIETDVLLTSWNGKQQFVGWIDAYGKWQKADVGEIIGKYEPIAWMPLPKSYKESEVGKC